MLVFNDERKLFMGERHRSPGVWQFPQGGVEGNVSLELNVLRELNEELGAEQGRFQIVRQLRATHRYEFAEPPPYAVGKWIGQQQTFWLVRFIGADDEIQLDRYEPELVSWRWCSVEEVRQIAEPRRLPGYLPALEEFESMLADGSIFTKVALEK